MHALLRKILAKRDIKKVEELSDEERGTFEQWNKTLNQGEIKISDIKEFCEAQLKEIEDQFRDNERSAEKTERLATLHSVYSSIRDLVDSPDEQREQLIKYLTSLL